MIKNMRIPAKRIPILIGKNEEIRKNIEKLTKTKIEIEEGITIEGEAIDVLNAENIIKAIGRGFPPEKALELMNEELTLCIIPLGDKNITRIKSRIIGTKGRAKKNIERLTTTEISIYGKTASIIGRYENVELARKAIEKLIQGSPHKNVYRFLEVRK